MPRMQVKGCPYKILGLKPGASHEEARAAWKSLMLKSHPDKRGDNGERGRALNYAHDLLKARTSFDIMRDSVYGCFNQAHLLDPTMLTMEEIAKQEEIRDQEERIRVYFEQADYMSNVCNHNGQKKGKVLYFSLNPSVASYISALLNDNVLTAIPASEMYDDYKRYSTRMGGVSLNSVHHFTRRVKVIKGLVSVRTSKKNLWKIQDPLVTKEFLTILGMYDAQASDKDKE